MKKKMILPLITIPVMTALVFTSCGQAGTGQSQSSVSTEVIESTEAIESTVNSDTDDIADSTEATDEKADNTEAAEIAEASDDAAGAEQSEETAVPESTDVSEEGMTIRVTTVKKHGNVLLETTFKEIEDAGMAVGDMITVTVGDKTYDMPIGTSYNDVDSGQMICRFDKDENEVTLGINMGSFAEDTGLAVKKTIDKDPGYEWDIKISEVGLRLKEKEGYLKEYNARNLTRSDNREDYPDLTDEEFANFRSVSVSGMKENTLYRSGSPLDSSIGRDKYTMTAMEKAGIKSVVNLSDSEDHMKEYDTYPGSYYSGCSIGNPEMNYDFLAPGFGEYVKKSVVFLTENDGPYLIHCKEGKDRTGILCALLEAFSGATADDIRNDYMLTYRNYYNTRPGDESYDIILNGNLIKTLCGLFGIDSIDGVNLKEKANDYFSSVGITAEQLAKLESILVGN